MVCRPLLTIALLLTVVTGRAAPFDDGLKDAGVPIQAAREGAAETTSAKRSTDVEAEARPVAPAEPVDGDLSEEAKHFPGRNPRVMFITMKGCERCARELARLRRPGGDFEAMRSRGWTIGESDDSHLQIVDRRAIPDLISQLNIREYPTVACVNDGEIVRSFKDGCTTPLDSWTFGWLLKGINERPQAPVLEPARVATTGSYRLRGNHWSVDGDWAPSRDKLVSHLRSPNHAGQLASNWRIEGWSYEELRSLHDDLHERELGAGSSGTGYAGEWSSGGQSGMEFGAGRKMLGR